MQVLQEQKPVVLLTYILVGIKIMPETSAMVVRAHHI